MRVHRKYETRGVLFLSLSGDPRMKVQEFIDKHEITWSSGYGASEAMIEALGAPNAGVMVPLLYVIGRDQRVAWCDQQARYKHQEPRQIVEALDRAIEAALTVPKVVVRETPSPAGEGSESPSEKRTPGS